MIGGELKVPNWNKFEPLYFLKLNEEIDPIFRELWEESEKTKKNLRKNQENGGNKKWI